VTEPLLTPAMMRRLDRLAVAARGPHAGRMQGERRGPRQGRSVEFADFRPYAAGDDLRQVDWNAYARLDRFFLKLFVEEEDATVHLLVDTSRSMAWGEPPKLDFARRVAAAVGYVALARLEWLSVAAFDATLAAPSRPARGRGAVGRLVGRLEALEAGGRTDLAGAMARYVASIRRPGPMLVLSDLYDAGWREALRGAVGAGYDLTVVHVLSPEEVMPELEGDLRLVDDETGEAVEVSAEGDTLDRYRAALAAWQRQIGAWCRARGVPYVPVTTDVGIEAFVVGGLRRGGVLVGR